MFRLFEKSETGSSTEAQVAKMTGTDEMLVRAVRFSEDRLQNIFERASRNDKIGMGGKIALGLGLGLLGVGVAKAGTFGLIGGGALTLASLVPVFMAKVGKGSLSSEVRQAAIERLVSDYKAAKGIPETVDFSKETISRRLGGGMTFS